MVWSSFGMTCLIGMKCPVSDVRVSKSLKSWTSQNELSGEILWRNDELSGMNLLGWLQNRVGPDRVRIHIFPPEEFLRLESISPIEDYQVNRPGESTRLITYTKYRYECRIQNFTSYLLLSTESPINIAPNSINITIIQFICLSWYTSCTVKLYTFDLEILST